MTTAIDRIRSKNKPVAKIESTQIAISSATRSPTRSPTVADNTAPNLTRETPEAADDQSQPKPPPPIPCPLCDCPAIWSSIYEPNTFRCCDCDPPPGGWHFRTGGWQFVARRSMIVLDRHPTTLADVWGWESFPRTNWDEELRLARAEQQRSAAA